MIVEKYDEKSGAILFKKDKESKDLERALRDIEELKSKVSELENIIKSLVDKKA